jgi:glycerol transport system permease protein
MKNKLALTPLLFALFLLLPIYWLLLMSVKTNAEIASTTTFWPNTFSLANFKMIISTPAWYNGYLNSAIYVLLNVAISLAVAVPAAFAFARYRFVGDRPLFFGLLLFRMLAPAILFIPFVEIFSRLNLIDTHIAVALSHCFFNIPLAIWILEGFIAAVPPEMDDLAKVDGHSFVSYFSKILLPQIAPGIAVAAFFCFMFSWIEFLLANALTVIKAKPIASIMTRAGGVLSGDFALLAAASVLGLIPGLIFIIFMRKHLARGFSMGRVV